MFKKISYIVIIVLAAAFLQACDAIISGLSSSSSRTVITGELTIKIGDEGLEGSCSSDPSKIARDTSVVVTAVDSNGTAVDIDINAVPEDATTTDCGTVSGSTYTTPSNITGAGNCRLTAVAKADPAITGSDCVQIVAKDDPSFNVVKVYEAASAESVGTGGIVAKNGAANIMLIRGTYFGNDIPVTSTMFSISTSNNFVSETVEDQISSLYSSGHSYPYLEDLLYDETIYLTNSGRCYFGQFVNYRPVFYYIDNCVDRYNFQTSDSNGPVIFEDTSTSTGHSTGEGISFFEDTTSGLKRLNIAWISKTERNGGDVYFDRCVQSSDGVFSCGTDICLTCGDDRGEDDWVKQPRMVLDNSTDPPTIRITYLVQYYALPAIASSVFEIAGTDGVNFSAPSLIYNNADYNASMRWRFLEDSSNNFYGIVLNTSYNAVVIKDDDGVITTGTIASELGSYQDLYLDGNNKLHAILSSNGKTLKYYTADTSDITTWTESGNSPLVSLDTTSLYGAQLAGYGDNLYLVYVVVDGTSSHIMARRSSDLGLSWGDSEFIVSELDGTNSGYRFDSGINVVADTNGIYVNDMGGLTICKNDPVSPSGLSCDHEMRVIGPKIMQRDPDMMMLTDSEYGLIWSDFRSGNYNLYYSTGTVGSVPNVSFEALTSDDLQNVYGKVLVDKNGTLHRVWTAGDAYNYYNIYYSYKPSGGSWSDPITINTDPIDDSGALELALDPSYFTVDDNGVAHFMFPETTSLGYRKYENGQLSSVITIPPKTGPYFFSVGDLMNGGDGYIYFAYFSGDVVGKGFGVGQSTLYFGKLNGETGEYTEVEAGKSPAFNYGGTDYYLFTGRPYITKDDDGRITILYEKYVAGELWGGHKSWFNNDISWVRSVDGGLTWTENGDISAPIDQGSYPLVWLQDAYTDSNGRVYLLFGFGSCPAPGEGCRVAEEYVAIGQ